MLVLFEHLAAKLVTCSARFFLTFLWFLKINPADQFFSLSHMLWLMSLKCSVKNFSLIEVFFGLFLTLKCQVSYTEFRFRSAQLIFTVKPGFHYTANAMTTTQKQSDYKVERSSFTLIALF